MRNVLDELRYNIKSGAFVNLALILQFVLFFWISTTISSYFLDIPITYSSNNIRGDSSYYSLFYSASSEEEMETQMADSKDPNFLTNLGNVYSEVHEDPKCHFMALREESAMLDYEEISSVFTDEELLDFYVDSAYPGYYNPDDISLKEIMYEYSSGEIARVFDAQAKQIDQAAMEHFYLQVSEGRLFEEKDFIFNQGQTEIPVLLGSAYAKGLQVGDTLRVAIYTQMYELKVVGILEENTVIATDQILETEGQPATLDYSIVYPFFYINYVPRTEAEQTFAEFNYESALQGTIVVDADAPRSEVNEAAKRVNNIFVKNGLYPITAIGGSYGVDIFKMESEQTMQILLGASAIMGVLSIFGICMNVTAKLNRNLHRYGIEIMNGQSVSPIMAAFLLEILLIIAAAMMFTIWRFSNLIMLNMRFLWVILALALLSVVIVSAVFTRKLLRVDIEEIVRSEE